MVTENRPVEANTRADRLASVTAEHRPPHTIYGYWEPRLVSLGRCIPSLMKVESAEIQNASLTDR